MRYSAAYLDRYFNTIEEYASKLELLTLARTGDAARFEAADWVTSLSELMNWQAMSERSGVWTYYESVNPRAAEATVHWMETLKGHNDLAMYAKGLDHYEDQTLMEEIDRWIEDNQAGIDQLIETTFRVHKKWFYEDLDV